VFSGLEGEKLREAPGPGPICSPNNSERHSEQGRTSHLGVPQQYTGATAFCYVNTCAGARGHCSPLVMRCCQPETKR
jgi:hypothetical protein